MKNIIPYIIITVLIITTLGFVTSQLITRNTSPAEVSTPTPAKVDLGTSPTPISEVKLDSKKAVDTGIDTEIKWIEAEEKTAAQADFSGSDLSDQELGL